MCNCSETCPPVGAICIPRGDSRNLIFTVRENNFDGDLFDVSGATEIVFMVADSNGGTVRITKTMTDTEVSVSTNNYQILVPLSSADTDMLVQQTNYYELRVTSSDGGQSTVSAGVFKSPDTMIKDLP